MLVFCFQLLLLFLANKKPQRGKGWGIKGVGEGRGGEGVLGVYYKYAHYSLSALLLLEINL